MHMYGFMQLCMCKCKCMHIFYVSWRRLTYWRGFALEITNEQKGWLKQKRTLLRSVSALVVLTEGGSLFYESTIKTVLIKPHW